MFLGGLGGRGAPTFQPGYAGRARIFPCSASRSNPEDASGVARATADGRLPRVWPGAHNLTMIFVILPAFNEERVIRPTLLALADAMRGGAPYRAVLVDDGSADGTIVEAERAVEETGGALPLTVLIAGGDLHVRGELSVPGPLLLVAGGRVWVSGRIQVAGAEPFGDLALNLLNVVPRIQERLFEALAILAVDLDPALVDQDQAEFQPALAREHLTDQDRQGVQERVYNPRRFLNKHIIAIRKIHLLHVPEYKP